MDWMFLLELKNITLHQTQVLEKCSTIIIEVQYYNYSSVLQRDGPNSLVVTKKIGCLVQTFKNWPHLFPLFRVGFAFGLFF